MGVTATTGAAALLIRGTTLHSFLGIGIGTDSVSRLVKKINFNNKTDSWKSLQILIIDEVSMLSVELFDKLECIARTIRGNDKPFGGIQLILSGDFLQLPTVKGEFCFKSPTWKQCIPHVICFDKILRQTDSTFHDILNRARFGKCTVQDVKYIKSNCLKNLPDSADQSVVIKPTILLCKRADTDLINNIELKKIKNAKIYEYKKTVVQLESADAKALNALNYIPESVSLCIGAQVMLTVNLSVDNGLVNGSRGIVVDFCERDGERLPVVHFVNKKITIDMYKYTI
jgi:ATP-dependent DNA helicase PIF1